MREYFCKNLAETEALGEKIGKNLTPGAVIAFGGGLGRGKTALTRGIAQGLGISCPVTSPTFTMVQEYQGGRLPLFHFDLYRLGENFHADSLYDLGFDEYFYRDGVCVIEWAELAQDFLAEFPQISIEILPGTEEDSRIFRIHPDFLGEQGS